MNALDTQIGGDHYKKFTKQPVELIAEIDANFFQGNVIKYIARWEDKNGIEDLKKALHYTQLAIELNASNHSNVTSSIYQYLYEYSKELKLRHAMFYVIKGEYAYAAESIHEVINSLEK